MKSIVFSGLAAILVPAVLAQTQANAVEFSNRSAPSASYLASSKHVAGTRRVAKSKSVTPRRRAGAKRRQLRKLQRPGRSPSANTAANVHALTVYLQWRKCLDNMLPKCP